MTRVNLVSPEELADQHLFAEFRELKMVPKSLARSLAAEVRRVNAQDTPATPEEAQESALRWLLHKPPKAYTLGKGHVSFFYDKGQFLLDRYSRIRHELRYRGVQFNEAALLDPDNVFGLDKRLAGTYAPPAEAVALNRARIAERLAARPGWYRWTNRSPRLA